MTDQNNEKELILALADMQGHCGFAGIFIISLWLVSVHNLTAIDIFSLPRDSWLVIFAIYAGFISPLYPLGPLMRSALGNDKIYNARIWLRATSLVCVAFISLIIYLSGGPQSPFIVFYTMTYTLTLTQIRQDNFEWFSLFAFALPIAGMFSLSYANNFYEVRMPLEIISFESLEDLTKEKFHFLMLAVGTILSLLIPTLSIAKIRSKYSS